MKKIGIITHYYKSLNYGGNLQAFALCNVLQQQGHVVEQISFPRVYTSLQTKRRNRFIRKDILKAGIRKISNILYKAFANHENKKHHIYEKRGNSFLMFNQNIIPHSEQVYNKKTLSQTIEKYDVFITGSDQVWNFVGDTPSYLLDFVPSNKVKISYAASIAKDSLTDEQKETFRYSLKDYKAVSVREKSAKTLLDGLSPVEVQTTLDPTLLLSRDDWDKVCTECMINDDYVFCYFLGDNNKARKLAKQFSRLHNLKLVTIPYVAKINRMDKNFGDVQLFDASPEQFISLIKHAKYVFTDSFHAVVFSNIYQKQYFVFNRSKKGEMSSRIFDITKLFYQEDRFCDTNGKASIEYVTKLSDIDYTKENKDFEKLKAESFDFLEKNLRD